MEKNKKLFIFLGVLLIVISCFFGISYALQRVSNTTKSTITTGSINGKIVTSSSEAMEVYPNKTIAKNLKLENTGSIDLLAKVTFTKKFGSSKDASGNLVQEASDASLNGSYLRLINNDKVLTNNETSTRWYEKDNCTLSSINDNCSTQVFYYKGTLAPSTTTEDLITGYKLYELAGNEYKKKFAELKVDVEMIQATEEAVKEIWSLNDSEIQEIFGELPNNNIMEDARVTFISPTEEFNIKAGDIDLFKNFKKLMPGVVVNQNIIVENDYESPQQIFLRAEITDQTDSENLEKIEKMLKEYAIITIKDGENVLYQGPIWGNLDGSYSNPNTMQDDISLGVINPDEEKELKVILSLSNDMGNEYENLTGDVKWTFTTVFSDSTVITHYYIDGSTTPLATDEVQTGKIGDTYTTTKKDFSPQYSYVRDSLNTTGLYDNGTIHVYYYYKLNYSTHTDPTIEITPSTDKIVKPEQNIEYTINYNTVLDNYYGDGTLTVVQKLPYPLDETYDNNFDGGQYDPLTNTITWVIPYNDIDTIRDEKSYNVNFSKNIDIRYKNLVDNQEIVSSVVGTLNLNTTEENLSASAEASVSIEFVNEKVPAFVTVKHIDIDTNKTIKTEEITGFIGDEYKTFPLKDLLDKGYTVVRIDGSQEGFMTKESVVITYYYRLATSNNPYTGDNIILPIIALSVAATVCIITIILLAKKKKKDE